MTALQSWFTDCHAQFKQRLQHGTGIVTARSLLCVLRVKFFVVPIGKYASTLQASEVAQTDYGGATADGVVRQRMWAAQQAV